MSAQKGLLYLILSLIMMKQAPMSEGKAFSLIMMKQVPMSEGKASSIHYWPCSP